MEKLLTLDYSTTSTGYAVFDIRSKTLLDFGVIKPGKIKKTKNQLRDTVAKLQSVADQIVALIEKSQPTQIVIEQVNLGKNRVSQKTLDGGHFLLYEKLGKWLEVVLLVDSDGPQGWRTKLNLKLTEEDKKSNAINSKLNKKKAKGTPDYLIVNKKHLAARSVNATLGTSFDVDKNAGDSDQVDAIGIGIARLLI
ncbi:MAG: hypothetical protein C5B47_08060 [Verrucomicrobia bacterium]|nr:MAG: hypothetical protein C5B47_08060 [Verrucomicrobiota bacterium]